MNKSMRRQKGVSLIEALVALLILAVGLLGVLAMQNNGIRANQEGYYQSQAMFLAEGLTERIRANREVANLYVSDYSDTGDGSTCETAGSNCTPAELAASDLSIWKTALGDAIVNAQGRVLVTDIGGNLVRVTVIIRYGMDVINDPQRYQLVTEL